MTNFRGQIVKETVTLLTGADSPPIRYEIRRTYTAIGQPESVHLVSAEGEALSLDHKVEYAWNANGQLASVKSLAGEFAYEYDAQNPALLTKMTGPVHTTETSYEPHRNLITGVTNRAKRITGIQPGPPSVVARSGVSEPKPAAPTLQDPAAQSADRIVSSYSYANDVLGRRETISQGGEAFALLKLGDTKIDVAYNDRSEVVGATYKTGNETRQQFSYDYDAIGNRRSFASEFISRNSEIRREEVSYKANALNQYQEISVNQRSVGVHPSYDRDGNLVEDDKNRYSWDSENRLIRVESKDGKTKVEYAYDHQSRRTIRREYQRSSKDSDFQLLTSVFYLYDGWNLLAEYSRGTGGWIDEASASPEGSESRAGDEDQLEATKHEVRYHTWGRDLSGSLQGAGGVGGLLAVTELGRNEKDSSSWIPASRFFLYDANGNVSQMVDESGAITAAYSYDPFGNVTEMAGAEAEANPWRFSTKPVDAGTGWLYYGYRYYDPVTGRWLNRDPIGERGGLNLYAMVGNNAVNTWDRLGLDPPGKGINNTECCAGKRFDSALHCCVNDKLIGSSEKETIKVCFRPADLPGGASMDAVGGKRHCWAKTSDTESGQGIQGGGVPGQPGGGSGYPGVPTTMNDHTGQSTASNSICVDVEVNKCCIEKELKLGQGAGRWMPLINDCNTVMEDKVKKCGGDWNKAYQEYLSKNQPYQDMSKLIGDSFGQGNAFYEFGGP